MLRFLNSSIEYIIIRAICFLIAIVLHEYAHGYVSYRLWDPTAKMQGRLSLNPLKHLDPIWTLMLFVVWIWWAKPVPINPTYYKNQSKWELLVALAWPLTNIALAFVSTFLIVFILFLTNTALTSISSSFLLNFLQMFAILNMLLALFNLIPIPPLDWFNIVKNFWPEFSIRIRRFQAQYGFFFIILLYFLLRMWVFDWIVWLAYRIVNIFYILFASIFL